MNKSELRETLEGLRADLSRLQFRDPQSRDRVQQLISAIERQIDNADDGNTAAGLRNDLKSAIERFEVEHPSLTATLNQIATSLSSMGI